MALGGNYGNSAGPTTNSKFRAYIEISISDQTATQYRLRHKFAISVDGGNFSGTIAHRSWGGDVVLYGPGWYGDSGWIDDGWHGSGYTLSLSCNVYYTGGSGATYSSICNASYTVPNLQSAPDAPTSVTLTRNSDTQLTLSWDFTATSNKPVTSQVRALKINEDSWIYTDINDDTTKSAIITAAANNRYYAGVKLLNSSGASAWTFSEYVYTSPATPSAAVAIKTGTNVSLQATVSNIKYPKSYQWQRASKSDFSDATTLSGTASVISDSTTLATPYYRVRCLGQSGTYSSWRTATLTTNPQLYVLVPDGKTIQDIYINKG